MTQEIKFEQFARDLQGVLQLKRSRRTQLDVISWSVDDVVKNNNENLISIPDWVYDIKNLFDTVDEDFETNTDNFEELYDEIHEIISNQAFNLPKANSNQINRVLRKKVVAEKIQVRYSKIRHPLYKNRKKVLWQIHQYTREQFMLNSTPYLCSQCNTFHRPETDLYKKHMNLAQIEWKFQDLIYPQIEREIRIQLDPQIRKNHQLLLRTLPVQEKLELRIETIPSIITSISQIRIWYQKTPLGFVPNKDARDLGIALNNGDYVTCVIGNPPEMGNLLISIGAQKLVHRMYNAILELVELGYPNMEYGIFSIGYGVIAKLETYLQKHPNLTIQKLIKNYYTKQEVFLEPEDFGGYRIND